MRAALRLYRLLLGAVAVLLLGITPALPQEDFQFMPKGGKRLLLELYGGAGDAAELQAIIAARHSEAEWTGVVAKRGAKLSDRERRTLAAYLAGTMPLAAKAGSRDEIAAALPPDGDELAWNNCQNCHSLFTGYLVQDRDQKGWLAIFLSPFHREIKMTQKEREAFARYSAINMPMRAEDVPAELRF